MVHVIISTAMAAIIKFDKYRIIFHCIALCQVEAVRECFTLILFIALNEYRSVVTCFFGHSAVSKSQFLLEMIILCTTVLMHSIEID